MSSSNLTNQKTPFRDAVFAPESSLKSSNMRYGENGCPEYSDTGSDLLTLSQMVRGSDPSSLCDQILSSSSVRDVSDLIILAFVTRNIRGGKGERDLSYAMFLRIWKHYPATAKKLLRLFANQYGCWKDLLLMVEKSKKLQTASKENSHRFLEDRKLTNAILEESISVMSAQLQSDFDALVEYETRKGAKDGSHATFDVTMKNDNGLDVETTPQNDCGPKISLLAKWLPRENSHFDKKLDFVKHFLQHDTNEPSAERKGWESRSQKAYRKKIAKLTSYLSLPEVFLSAQRADEMNFHKLASKATLKLSKALLNENEDGSVKRPHDNKRKRCADMFAKHLVNEGLKGAALMPDEIVGEIMKKTISPMREKVLDAQWKDMWKSVVDQVKAKAKEEGLDFDPSKMVPLSDVSGSMSGKPMEVSIAMGIGISEITHPAFRDMVLTFETRPQWHKLNSGDSIVKKVRSLEGASWGGSTNFEAAYDKVLEICVENNLAKEDVPSLIVFSDMQFNVAHYGYGGYGYDYRGETNQNDGMATMHDAIRSKFAVASKKLKWKDADPTPIVYWNLRDTGGHPVEKDTEGAVLLSGFSPSMLKLVMNGEALEDKEVEVVEADGTIRTEKMRVTPAEVLRKTLDDSLYDPIRDILATSNEGVFKSYKQIDPSGVLGAESKSDIDVEFELL